MCVGIGDKLAKDKNLIIENYSSKGKQRPGKVSFL